jgi:hypothetical protein
MDGKFCINCVWFSHESHGYDGYDLCRRRLSDRRDPVTGKFDDTLGADCSRERGSDHTLLRRRERCGPSGKFYEDRR